MRVRGWMIVGGLEATAGMPADAAAVRTPFAGNPPDAARFNPGTWTLWQPTPDAPMIALVCVEVPL